MRGENWGYNIVLDRNYNTGRLNLYLRLIDILKKAMDGNSNVKEVLNIVKLFGVKEKDMIEENDLSPEVVLNLRAINCLEISNIEKEAYLTNLLKFYEERGYNIGNKVAPDHIMTELAFIALLIRQTLESSSEEIEKLLKIQSRFINTHIKNWLTKCMKRYKIASILWKIIQEDVDLIMAYFKNRYISNSV